MANALPDTVVTTVGTPVTIDVLANDAGSGLVLTSFSNPANGNLVYNSDKTLTYTPAAGFTGDDTFSYTMRDAAGTPSKAEVTISVLADADATVAMDDSVEMIAGGSVVVPVLANDLAAGGGALEVIAVSAPGHGVVNVLSDQSIRYVPQSDFIGIDSFVYTVLDEKGATASAAVTVKVVAGISDPIAADDSFDVVPDETTVLAILANDSDPNGGPLKVVGFTMPGHGSLVFNAVDKTFSYTPDAGYEGQDQFTYTIRDNRGTSASASVMLTVAQPIGSPVAVDDQVNTEAGQPVVIDVLANDSLPEGQAFGIIAVTLPFKGKLTFNSDKTITYTPNAGFVGTDDFTYTIGNRKGTTAKATVTIEVTPGSANVYANGYAYRRRIAIPASSAKGSNHENFPLRVELSGSWLKSAANGGKVARADGHDLRFELTNGTKLAHELEHYDAEAGKLDAWVRMPELYADQPTVLLLYYGKPGLAESEAEPATVWEDYLAVWHLPGTVDSSGEARSLTAAGTIGSSADGLGAGALELNSNGMLTIADTSWLDANAAISIQLRGKAQSIGHNHGLLGAGPSLFSGDGDLFIRYQSVGYGNGQPQNILHSSLATTAGRLRASSAANTQTTSWQSIALTWQGGDAQSSFYLDGSKVEPSFATSEGGSATQISGPLYIGAATQDSSEGGWSGLIDEVRFRAAKLSDAWIRAEYANQKDTALFYGFGAEEDFGDSNQIIIALPFERTTPVGEHVDIDVLAEAVSPGNGIDIAIQGVSQPANGIASIFDNEVRYSPNASFSGNDSFTYTLIADGKTSTAKIGIAVKAATASPPDPITGTAHNDVGALSIDRLQGRTVNVSNNGQLSNALSKAQPGDHIVLANGSYSGFTISRNGTRTNPIVIRSADPHGAVISGTISLTGNWGIVSRVRATDARITGNDCRLSRCYIGSGGIYLGTGNRCTLDYNEVRNYTRRGIWCRPSASSGEMMDHWLHHNYIKDGLNSGNTTALNFSGGSWQATPKIHNALVEYNLAEGCRSTTTIGTKVSGNTYRFNTIRDNEEGFAQRHGTNNIWIGNSSFNSKGFQICGRGHQIIGNYSDGADGSWTAIGLFAGNTTSANFLDYINAGLPNGSPYERAENCLVVGNTGALRVGAGPGSASLPALNNTIEAHDGSVVLASGRHSGTIDRRNDPPGIGIEVPQYVILQPSDVGPRAL